MRIYCQELQGDVIVKQLIGICKGSIPGTYIRIIKDRYLTMKYKAIALDLDGTLTDHNKKLPEANKEAVWAAIDKDVTVILASGRPLFGITPIADELELDKRGGYILAYNGGEIINCLNGDVIVSHELPRQCIDDICDYARANDVYALTYSDGKIAAESDDDEYVLKEAFCNNTTIIKTDDLKKYVDYPVNKFLVVGRHDKLVPVQEALLEHYSDVLDAFYSEDYFLEVVPKGVAKDKSLQQLLGKLSIKEDELIACGDGMNDIPMLKIAGVAAVMDNAYEEVKKYADYIAPSNDESGVADIIKRFILNA